MTSVALHKPNLLIELHLGKQNLSEKSLLSFFQQVLGRLFSLVNELWDNSSVTLSTPALATSRKLLSL